MDDSLKIVVYTGGTCGDLIGALIDPSHARLNGTTVSIDPLQQKLKKPHLFNNDVEKDNYLENVTFKSIVSHDFEYHKRKKHKFISIIVDDKDLAIWAATRFKNLHRPHVWNEMQNFSGASTIEEYARLLIDFSNMVKNFSEYTINLKEIVSGKAIDILKNITNKVPKDSHNLYNEWLISNNLTKGISGI